MNAVIIQFIDFENEGSLYTALNKYNYTVDRYFAGTDDLSSLNINKENIDLLIILGGPIGVYDQEAYPYLNDIIGLIEARLTKRQAMIGICLGCQLIAHAAGSKVYPGDQKEIGWSTLNISDNTLIQPIKNTPVLHWHGDTFDLPDGATALASSSMYPNQGFLLGNNILGLQFHLEVTEPNLERWYLGHAHEISSVETLSVAHLRRDGKRYSPALEAAATSFWALFLSGLADTVAVK